MSEAPAIRVRPMTAEEFSAWQEHSFAAYAVEVSEARGIPFEDARRIAAESHARYLPDGQATAGVHLVVGEDAAGARVGILWVGPNPNGVGPAWVYDIEVEEPRRGEGWGRALMREAERLAREDGHAEIGLNVFGSNTVARRLYESLGFATSSVQMRKPL
ncbi:N-acetyltransferase family protein [Pseudolysinimonas sp.]|uniref:GNAT family N-acetyltransferase n=1 Tax=Pseudolysinimonas sp. TaxID=2680009 RepID=UPI003F8048F5